MVKLHVDGREQTADPDRNLLTYLRLDLGLTGTKYGCGEGLRGTCPLPVTVPTPAR